jgi:hypothetical protein
VDAAEVVEREFFFYPPVLSPVFPVFYGESLGAEMSGENLPTGPAAGFHHRVIERGDGTVEVARKRKGAWFPDWQTCSGQALPRFD